MANSSHSQRNLRLDPDSFAGGFFRHAVHNTWDPYDDVSEELLAVDRENFLDSDITSQQFAGILSILARFGAGEEAVTEDLAPLLLTLDDINDEMFVAAQIYDEALHTEFFDRYWREVLLDVSRESDWPTLLPADETFFNDEYVELFDRTDRSMSRLLDEDTPENRVRAYCHYHVGIESILAQTGYWNIATLFGTEDPSLEVARQMPDLPGLVAGIENVRADEGRHVVFGMHKIRRHIERDAVDPAIVEETLETLFPLIAASVAVDDQATEDDPVVAYARSKLDRRLATLTDETAPFPLEEDADTEKHLAEMSR